MYIILWSQILYSMPSAAKIRHRTGFSIPESLSVMQVRQPPPWTEVYIVLFLYRDSCSPCWCPRARAPPINNSQPSFHRQGEMVISLYAHHHAYTTRPEITNIPIGIYIYLRLGERLETQDRVLLPVYHVTNTQMHLEKSLLLILPFEREIGGRRSKPC